MLRIFSLSIFFSCAFFALKAQITEGNDPLGRPYTPIVGILKSEVAPGIPSNVAKQISIAFQNGIKGTGGTQMPYSVVDKEGLSVAVAALKSGKSAESLRGSSLWDDMVGVQYLLRLEINSYETMVDLDSVFDEKHKFSHIDKHQVSTANMTARLVDVATSKVLLFNNFDAGGTTRGYEEFKTQAPEDRALHLLTNQVTNYGRDMLKSVVAGAPAITAIYKESKDRAEEVVITRTMLSAPANTEDLNVYVIHKTYTIQGQTFRDAELVGAINRGKTFNPSTFNFKVTKGEKKIAELFKAGKPLICVQKGFPIGPFLPSDARVGLTFQDFKNTSTAPGRVVRILQDGFVELAANKPLLQDAVDRELYDLVKKERELQQKTQSDATQAGISIGSNFILNTDMVAYSTNKKLNYTTITEEKPIAGTNPSKAPAPAPTTQSKNEKTQGASNAATKKDKTTATAPPAPAKPAAPTTQKITKKVPGNYAFTSNATLNVSLVSVETGEIAFTNSYSLEGTASIPYTKDIFEQNRGQEQSFRALVVKASQSLWGDIQKFTTPPFNILEVVESGKNGAEKVLVAGGDHSGFYEGMRIEVVEVVQEDVDGKKLDRDVVIGALKIIDLRPETSICNVKEGEKEITAKIGSGAKIYCRKAK